VKTEEEQTSQDDTTPSMGTTVAAARSARVRQ
jgi:hypothetical protein